MRPKRHIGKYPIHKNEPAIILCIAAGLLALTACAAQYPLNPKVDVIGRADPYQKRLPHIDPSARLFLIIAFSGGGTRATSLAYGTLEALKRVDLPQRTLPSLDGTLSRTLLDEVSVVTAVSGGSFTAAYYGLHGEGIFKDFRERFLTRDVQGDLVWKFLNPFNWPRLWSPRFGRSDMAQEYYDSILFNGATLADMAAKKGPFILLQATDVIDGIVFPFMPRPLAGFVRISTDTRFPEQSRPHRPSRGPYPQWS